MAAALFPLWEMSVNIGKATTVIILDAFSAWGHYVRESEKAAATISDENQPAVFYASENNA